MFCLLSWHLISSLNQWLPISILSPKVMYHLRVLPPYHNTQILLVYSPPSLPTSPSYLVLVPNSSLASLARNRAGRRAYKQRCPRLQPSSSTSNNNFKPLLNFDFQGDKPSTSSLFLIQASSTTTIASLPPLTTLRAGLLSFSTAGSQVHLTAGQLQVLRIFECKSPLFFSTSFPRTSILHMNIAGRHFPLFEPTLLHLLFPALALAALPPLLLSVTTAISRAHTISRITFCFQTFITSPPPPHLLEQHRIRLRVFVRLSHASYPTCVLFCSPSITYLLRFSLSNSFRPY
jgi:hypothetical protein